MKKTVLFGFLGSKRDAGEGAERWKAWRPTLALGMYEDLNVDRLELFCESGNSRLLDRIVADYQAISPQTVVKPNLIDFKDAWDFEEVYGKLFDFARSYAFDTDAEDYLIHIKTGTHAAQICLFLLTESRYLPGRLLQTFPPGPDFTDLKPVGTYKIIALDLSKYEQIASRFALDRSASTVFLKSGIETKNRAFNRLIEEIEWIATRSPSPILLTGGTGVGKSQLAERIFELKKHQGHLKGRFVLVNSAVLRDAHAMSTLFGHKKGAFTGAEKDRDGLLRKADGGLLFLDEIGELGLDEQAMLLRAIESGSFCQWAATMKFPAISS